MFGIDQPMRVFVKKKKGGSMTVSRPDRIEGSLVTKKLDNDDPVQFNFPRRSNSADAGASPETLKYEPNSVSKKRYDESIGTFTTSDIKEPALAAVLAGLFGGLGLLYVTTFRWAVAVVLAQLVLYGITGGLGVIPQILIFGYAGYTLAIQHNETILRKHSLKAELENKNTELIGFDVHVASQANTPTQQSSDTSFVSCCGATYTEQSKFCAQCGSKLDHVTSQRCCGETFAPNARFCSICGATRRAA